MKQLAWVLLLPLKGMLVHCRATSSMSDVAGYPAFIHLGEEKGNVELSFWQREPNDSAKNNLVPNHPTFDLLTESSTECRPEVPITPLRRHHLNLRDNGNLFAIPKLHTHYVREAQTIGQPCSGKVFLNIWEHQSLNFEAQLSALVIRFSLQTSCFRPVRNPGKTDCIFLAVNYLRFWMR